jgi:DNA processing protein
VTTAAAHVAALASLELVGPARMRWLLSCGDPRSTWDRLVQGRLGPDDGADEPPRDPAGSFPDALRRWNRSARAAVPREMARRLDALGVEVLVGDAVPARLRDDGDPPAVLFCRGTPGHTGARVAVVGTRKATPYGLRASRALGRDLAEAGVGVVSGLALGIDGAAHAGALEAPVGRGHVAVLGAGHDRPCPVRNRTVAEGVARAGALISEVPPGVDSAPWRYPVRNRLIAALCDVLVVVESAAVGGSMLTVGEALGRDRPVMAVPGPVDRPASSGCHDLLRDGAEICTGAGDVLALLGLLRPGPVSGDSHAAGTASDGRARLSATARQVLDLVDDGPCSVDAVMTATGAGLSELASVLVELEVSGLVHRRAGWLERCP